MKLITLIISLMVSFNILASGGGTGSGGGPKLTPDNNRVIIPIGGEITNPFNLGDGVTFNPDLIKNVQLNDGQIIGLGQFINPKDNALVDMSAHNNLYQMGVDNIEMNSGEIILVEPQGFYIDQ
jgi:hypothetical protein